MKALPLAVGLLCVLPLVGLAEPLASRSGARPNPETRAPDAKAQQRKAVPSDEQVAEAEEFFKINSPAHYAAYRTAMDRPGLHPFLRKWITHNHAELKKIESADPELFSMKLEQLKIEDRIFGVMVDAREKKVGDHEQLHASLEPLMKELVAKRKEEAAHRIEKMKLALQNEEKQLTEMNENPGPWIEARIKQEIAHGGRLVLPSEPRRPATTPTTSAN